MSHVVDLIFGRWRSQILYAGAALDVFAYLKPNQDRAASIVAEEIGVNPTILYRLLRVLAALAEHDLSAVGTICDVAGGHGHFACGLLNAYPHLSAIVFDRPEVVAQTDRLWARRLGLADRCRYLGGDMFSEVPAAEAYT